MAGRFFTTVLPKKRVKTWTRSNVKTQLAVSGVLQIKIFYLFITYLCIYLAAPSLSCSIHYLHCGTWLPECKSSVVTPMECGILVPQPGIRPASPALEGRFLTSGPPGKVP